MTHLRAAIFDMDGLMFDTESIYCRTSQHAARELGYDIDDTLYRQHFAGQRIVDSEAFLLSHFGDDFPLTRFRSLSESYLRDALAAGVPVKPGLDALLDWLDDTGVRLALATSSVRAYALLTLGHYAARFEILVTGDQVSQGKPAPEIYLRTLQRLSVQPEHCVVFEDSTAGVRAGHAAGLRVIWVPDLQAPKPEMVALAWRVCTTLDEARLQLAEAQ
jgi:HAD superfamily hydrolase (TIGR01509 family)